MGLCAHASAVRTRKNLAVSALSRRELWPPFFPLGEPFSSPNILQREAFTAILIVLRYVVGAAAAAARPGDIPHNELLDS